VTREFRVSHARVELLGLGAHSADAQYFERALDQSWVPGTRVSRYGRPWILSARAEPEPGMWAGHMGFVTEGELSTLEWDELTMDFVRGEASSGVVVPFVVSIENRIVSYQLFSDLVRQTTVTSNLQALLNKEGTHHWAVRAMSLRRTFDEWLDSVSLVSSFNFRLTYPNPGWVNREKIEDLMTGWKAEILSIRGRAAKNRTIKTNSDWFEQAMDHVRLGYGSVSVTGPEKDTGAESLYRETKDGGVVPVIERMPAEEGAYEVSAQELSAAQARHIESHLDDMVELSSHEGVEDDDDDDDDDDRI